jgi:NADH dehydrogenase
VDPGQARVILLEAGSRILAHLAPELSASAQRQLERLGVEVRTGSPVRNIAAHRVELEDGRTIAAANIIWAAGIAAHPLTRQLGVELDRVGRVKVGPDLSIPGHPEAFAIGDVALVIGADGKPVPGVSPAAMQMARHVARIIKNELCHAAGKTTTISRPPFRYFDRGTMATIGRSAAVAQIGRFRFNGWSAWIAWLFVHLIFLIGFDNKLGVLLQWTYSYFTYRRGARIIVDGVSPSFPPNLSPQSSPVGPRVNPDR